MATSSQDVQRSEDLPLRGDREIVIAAVSENGRYLKDVSRKWRNDPEIVRIAVSRSWRALQFASEELSGNRDIVMMAVLKSGEALKFASDQLRADREIVEKAASNHWRALQYASEEQRGNREMIMTVLSRWWEALQFASEELKADREVVMKAVSKCWWALCFASEDLKCDRDIVAQARTWGCDDSLVLKVTMLSGRSASLVIEKAVGSTAWKILKGLEGRSRVSTVEAQICQISMFIGNSMCNGLHTANLGGMGLVFCTLIMIGCFVAAGLLTYSYKNTPKKQHRETAFICICIGTLLHSIASIVYDGIVAFGMEKMHDDWPLELQILLGPDRSTGLTWGFFIVLLMIIFNVISVILHSNVKLKEEDRLVDMKRQREFENEMMEEQNAYGGYNSHGYAGAGVASRYTGHAGGQPQVSYNYGWPQPANTGAYGGYGMHQQRAW